MRPPRRSGTGCKTGDGRERQYPTADFSVAVDLHRAEHSYDVATDLGSWHDPDVAADRNRVAGDPGSSTEDKIGAEHHDIAFDGLVDLEVSQDRSPSGRCFNHARNSQQEEDRGEPG
jgi:hypothetical protein